MTGSVSKDASALAHLCAVCVCLRLCVYLQWVKEHNWEPVAGVYFKVRHGGLVPHCMYPIHRLIVPECVKTAHASAQQHDQLLVCMITHHGATVRRVVSSCSSAG